MDVIGIGRKRWILHQKGKKERTITWNITSGRKSLDLIQETIVIANKQKEDGIQIVVS